MNHASSEPGFPYGSGRARRLGASERELLAADPSLRAEDLVNAWPYAHSHAAEMEEQIRENEAT